MPVKTGGKGHLQSYDPNTGKFGSGAKPTEITADNALATVTIEWKGQIVQVVGKLTKSERKSEASLPKEEAPKEMSFKEAVEWNKGK